MRSTPRFPLASRRALASFTAPGLAASAIALAAVAACSGGGDPARPSGQPPTQITEARPPNRCVVPERTPGLARLVPLGGAPFAVPVEMVPHPADGALYLAEMTGRVFRLAPDGSRRVVLDLDGKMNVLGMRALALHPDGTRAFVVVERPAVPEPGDSATAFESEVLSFSILPNGDIDVATEALVLRVHIPFGAHSVDTLRFGPDGMLYVSIGDAGTSLAYAQPKYDPTKLLGAILRLDVSQAPYAIPPDNPFVGVPGRREEVFAYGFRNPWKFSFGPDGRLWVGDVGEATFEEIDVAEAGGDYGWPTIEGTGCAPAYATCDPTGTKPPVFQYTHASGNSITGGFVYRGKRIPALAGRYVYADFQGSSVWALDVDTKGAEPALLNAGEAKPHAGSLAEDEDGELYVLDWLSGIVYRLEADASTPEVLPFADRLSETGCFEARDPTRPDQHLVPYDVNVEFWSDGAGKRRYLSLPDGEALTFDAQGHAVVPPGGLAIKTFYVEGRPLETRFLGRQRDGGWVGASYVWDEDGGDARRVGTERELPLPGGGKWTVPAPGQCFFCHTAGAGVALGLVQEQLDVRAPGDGGLESQLDRLERAGVLRGPRAPVTPLPRVDGEAPAEDRVRAYLAGNCSMCHRYGQPIFSALDLRFSLPFEDTGICTMVTRGSPETSILSLRMHIRGIRTVNGMRLSQMPPTGSNVPDPFVDAVLDPWLRATQRCAP